MRRHLIALALGALLASGPALAYTIYLKDGSRLQADSKYVVQGENAIITLPNGTKTSIRYAEIDVERTDRANEHELGGGSLVVEGGQVHDTPPPVEPPRRGPTLSDVAATRTLPSSFNRPRDQPTAGAPVEIPRTPSGSVDLLRFQRQPYPDSEISGRVLVLLRNQGVAEAATYRGTQSDYLFVEVTTNSEAAVFRALDATASVLRDIVGDHPEVAAIELFLANDRRIRSGQFLFTLERANELATSRIDTQDFFVKYVEF